ncbi:hypothetical protein CAPTEDRAFT_101032 [Capitella teleta]|uniref:DDE Tnp4 domain-containing protein n=1 Tax=Capitella teleta TaxID=283909 RepID=R7TYX8_CAPTE|nr:hypothetical protein CAPTEDRAFT_101032 [Capitella teleta]|eukprot:ELT98802.1 hypothetical protein CAPTEDRAFT_101032 [Capitella teleta]
MYTGLESCLAFYTVLQSLGPAATCLTFLYGSPELDAANQFFLTLIKLRTYKTNKEIALLFRIKEPEVYNIFVTWVRFMSLQWQMVDYYFPFDFKSKFPSTRIIFDGTEIPIKKPSDPVAQQATFSTYKNRNTAKSLIGITPGGLTTYVSDCYGGSTSDRQIVERSTIKVEKGDSMMADKGFNVQDLFASQDVAVNIPAFFKKQNRIQGDVVLSDCRISSKRTHVERVIGLGKTYKILTHPLNHSETILSSDIVFICLMLANFRPCIVPKTA